MKGFYKVNIDVKEIWKDGNIRNIIIQQIDFKINLEIC
jgi:hypothetical protein